MRSNFNEYLEVVKKNIFYDEKEYKYFFSIDKQKIYSGQLNQSRDQFQQQLLEDIPFIVDRFINKSLPAYKQIPWVQALKKLGKYFELFSEENQRDYYEKIRKATSDKNL